VERKANLTRDAFAPDHLAGEGVPVIVTDAVAQWPAARKWTFDHFRATYGSDIAVAPLGLMARVGKTTNIATYIDHITRGAPLPGFWVDPMSGAPLAPPADGDRSPAYLLGWHAFERHPELLADLSPPAFVDDWTWALDAGVRQQMRAAVGCAYWSIYLGPTDSLSPLHQDFSHTHAYLAMITGSKRALLFAPSESPRLYGGAVDPEHPDPERHPDFADATAYECVLGPGELLFMPADWWHHVRGLTPSITVSHNFFNATNASAHLREAWPPGTSAPA
jgi:hypothetical protein